MYLSKDREQAPKSSKKMIIAAAAGMAVVGVATVSYMGQEDSMDFTNLALNNKESVALGNTFYEIADSCDAWYHDASKLFLKGQDAFLPQAKLMWENKILLTRYGKQAYHSTMSNMQDQIEQLIDAQLNLEGVYTYSDKYYRLVSKNIPKNKWRVVLKWSTKVTDNCIIEEQKQLEEMRKLKNLSNNSKATLTTLANTVVKNAKNDLAKWDCEGMYPKPIQHKVDWLKTIMDAAKEGFAIFNQVKGMIPDGAMDNLKIPGLPAGMTDNIGSAVKTFEAAESKFNQFKDVADQVQGIASQFTGGSSEEFEDFEEDLEMDLLEDKKIFGGETDSAFRERQKLRKTYVDQCFLAKGKFQKTVSNLVGDIKVMARHPVANKVVEEISDELASKAANYKTAVYKHVATTSNMMTDAEEKAFQGKFDKSFNAFRSNYSAVLKAKKSAYVKKAMLLQTGQE